MCLPSACLRQPQIWLLFGHGRSFGEGLVTRKPLSPAEERFINIRVQDEESRRAGQEPLPPPPYQVGDVRLLFTGVRFAPGVARRLLPPELEPAGNDAGLICAYTVGTGWGVAPYSSLYAAVEVKGVDAPDGSSGYCIVAGWYSGGGYRFMHRYYNLLPEEGGCRLSKEGGLEVAVGGPAGVDAVTMRIRRTPKGPPQAAVVHHYLGKHPTGGASLFAIAFSGMAVDAEPVSLEISGAAGERMCLARPTELTYALDCYDSNLTFGVPQTVGSAIDLPGAGAQVTVLDAFSRIGRAAILVSSSGEIGAMTPQARTLIGDGLSTPNGRVRATSAGDQPALERLIAMAVGGGSEAQELSPIALRRRAVQPLVVEAISIGSAATGRPSALLMLHDTEQAPTGNANAVLQLLGLTPAESRIPDLVGTGLTPREAADRLNNTENTVRSSLNKIYQKLNINRQAELARIVARI